MHEAYYKDKLESVSYTHLDVYKRQGAEYALLDVKQNRYPILCDESCRTHILHYEVRNHIDSIPEAKQHGIQHFLCTFTMEGEADCHRIITACKAQLQMKQGV